MIISDKERSKIWHRKERIKARKRHREAVLQRRGPIIWVIKKIIDALKFKKNHRKRPEEKFFTIPDEIVNLSNKPYGMHL